VGYTAKPLFCKKKSDDKEGIAKKTQHDVATWMWWYHGQQILRYSSLDFAVCTSFLLSAFQMS